MGESRCHHCGHIVTDFEQQEFALRQTDMARLRNAIEDAIDTLEAMNLHIDNPLYARLRAAIEPTV